MQAMGGEIWASAQTRGSGALFGFTLPILAEGGLGSTACKASWVTIAALRKLQDASLRDS